MSSGQRPVGPRQIAALMVIEAATLVVMSALHLTDTLHGGAKPFDRMHAGIAEAVIAVVLVVGAATIIRTSGRVTVAAMAATGFAIVGFIVGITFTFRGGDGIGVAYHAAVLPLFLVTLALLLRERSQV